MALRIGIVGVGNIGSTHGGCYKNNPKCEIVACCDIIREKADAGAAKFGGKAFYSVKEMLASGIKLDACTMATKGEENGGDHFTPTMELLEAGIPTLGEKPISNNIEHAEQMVALVNDPRFSDGRFRGRFIGRIGTEDTERFDYVVALNLTLRDSVLNGAATATGGNTGHRDPRVRNA